MKRRARREQARAPALPTGTKWPVPRRVLSWNEQTTSSWPRASGVLGHTARPRLGIDAAEAVLQKDLQRDILLTNEAALWQGAGGEQIEHRTDRRRRRDLNRAQRAPIHISAVDLVGIGLLNQSIVLAAADGHEDDDHILQRRRHGVLEKILQHVAAIP